MKHAMVHVSGLRFYSWLSLVPNPHDKGGFRTSHGLRGEYCTIFEFIIICSILSFEANLQSLKVWVFIARSQFVFPFQVWLHFLFRLCFKCFSISLTAVGTSKSAPFHDRENWPKHRGFKLVTLAKTGRPAAHHPSCWDLWDTSVPLSSLLLWVLTCSMNLCIGFRVSVYQTSLFCGWRQNPHQNTLNQLSFSLNKATVPFITLHPNNDDQHL